MLISHPAFYFGLLRDYRSQVSLMIKDYWVGRIKFDSEKAKECQNFVYMHRVSLLALYLCHGQKIQLLDHNL